MGTVNISILMYADDIVLISNTEENLQVLLETLHNWCKKWRVLINTAKSKCVHFRQGNAAISKFSFKIGDNILETVEKFKYLGVIFQEKNNFSLNCEALAKCGGRALGSFISKYTISKVSNGAKIRNRYNQVPHLTQDTNGKVTNSQKTPQTRAKRPAPSQQVTTKHI